MKKFLKVIGIVAAVLFAGAALDAFLGLGGVSAMERRMGFDDERHYFRSSCRGDKGAK